MTNTSVQPRTLTYRKGQSQLSGYLEVAERLLRNLGALKRPLMRLAAAVVAALISISASAELPPPVAVLTQRYNNQRTGTNDQERVLTVDAVSSSEFQLLYSISVTGQVYAQPLLYELSVPCGRDCDPGHTNVLIIATMHNDVYAYSVDDAIGNGAFPPKFLWSVNIGSAV